MKKIFLKGYIVFILIIALLVSSSGNRYGNIKAVYAQDGNGYYNNDVGMLSLSVFQRIGVIGDSYASGELHCNGTYVDKYEISWGQILARKYNFTCTNYSKGGLDTRSWLTDNRGLSMLKNSPPDDLYLLVLGINDYLSNGESYRGTIEDITNYESYLQYPDSFYGNYGKIIEQVLEHAPNAKLVIFSILNNPALPHPFDSAVYEIANHYQIPYVIQYEDPFFATPVYTNMSVGHPTALGYSGMACAYERLLIDCMMNKYDYFFDLYMH